MLENQDNEKNEKIDKNDKIEKIDEIDVESERDYGSAILSIIRGDNDDALLRELLEDYHDNDIASILDELTAEERERLLRVLGIDAMSDILPYADDAAEYIAEMDADEAADVIEQMEIDRKSVV